MLSALLVNLVLSSASCQSGSVDSRGLYLHTPREELGEGRARAWVRMKKINHTKGFYISFPAENKKQLLFFITIVLLRAAYR